MTFRIQSPTAQAALATSATDKASKTKEDTAKVGRDFEAILVRQMLSQTKIAGKGGGYADMAVEALATSIGAAGGLGMGRAIEEALSASGHAKTAPTSTTPVAATPLAAPSSPPKK